MQYLTNKLRIPTEQVLLEKLSSSASPEKFESRKFIIFFFLQEPTTFQNHQMNLSYAFSFYLFKISLYIILPSTSRSSKVSLCFRCLRPEELCQWKLPVTPPGMKPATFRLVAQCFNQLRYRVPKKIFIYLNIHTVLLSQWFLQIWRFINLLNPELNPICYLLALLAHHFLHVSRIRVKSLTLRLLMSYIYGAPILDISRSHTTTQHSR